MRYPIVLLLLLLFYGPQLQAQGKLSWYYPRLEKVPVLKKKGGPAYFMNIEAKGCVSGNCIDGEGTFLNVTRVGDSTFGFMALEPVLRVTIHKGRFSNGGQEFSGTIYSRKVYYDIDYSKDYKEATFIPKVDYNLKDEAFWTQYAQGTGNMKMANGAYRWQGWMEQKVNSGPPQPGQPASFKMYFDSYICYLNVQYAPGGAYTTIEGRAGIDGQLVGGRIRFADSSVYEGFLYRGKRFGPGRYTTPDGKEEEGIWMLDTLSTPMAVQLQPALFQPVTGPTIISSAYRIGNGEAQPVYDAGGGWAYMDSRMQLFLGKWDSGHFRGPGFSLFSTIAGSGHPGYNSFRTGLFHNGQQVSGMHIDNSLTWDKALFGFAIDRSVKHSSSRAIIGQFKGDHHVTGCGKMLALDSAGNTTAMHEGWIDAWWRAQGWIYINDWEGKRDAAHLQFLVNSTPYLTMPYDSRTVNDYIGWVKHANSGNYCIPEVNKVMGPLLTRVMMRTDSIIAATEQNAAALAAQKEAAEKRKVACDAVAARYPFGVGEMFQMDSRDGSQNHILITGKFDCDRASFPAVRRYWKPTDKGGYYTSTTTHILATEVATGRKVPGLFTPCTTCKGTGSVSEESSVFLGDHSRHTDRSNAWAVNSGAFYSKQMKMVKCTAGCGGGGFLRQ